MVEISKLDLYMHRGYQTLLRELPRVPLRGEGSCVGGGAPRVKDLLEDTGVTRTLSSQEPELLQGTIGNLPGCL